LNLELRAAAEYAGRRVKARRRQVAILIALVASIWVDAAWAGPVRTLKALAASACCVAHCARLAGAVCDNGCCPATRRSDSPVVQRDEKQQHHTAAMLVTEATASPVAVPRSPTRPLAPSERAGSDPPPIFLLTRTLRI
jgi:hypothetical protein